MLNSQMLEAAGVSSGWLAVAAIGVAVVAYFLGCFNGAVVVSRYILRDDIRDHGSGNAGLTNFYRTFGGPLTAVVILSDVLKAVLAVLFAMFIAGHISPALVTLSKYWAGAFCIIGHMYPCTFQFRGGKGVLSGGAIAIMIGIGTQGGTYQSWWVPLVVWGGFIILAASTKYVSLGSCWAGFSFPFVSWFVYRDPLVLLLSVVMGGLLLWKHRGNMVRIVKGTESKFVLHGGSQSRAAKKAEEKREPEPQPEGGEEAGPEAVPAPAPEEESRPTDGAAGDKPAPRSKRKKK